MLNVLVITLIVKRWLVVHRQIRIVN